MVDELVIKNINNQKFKISDREFHHKYVYFIIDNKNQLLLKIKHISDK